MNRRENVPKQKIPKHLRKRYSLVPSSSLHSYFVQINQNTSGICLVIILRFVKQLILDGRHYDERNPSIILCYRSQQLENIFGMKALHVSQVQSALAKSLVALNTPENSSGSDSGSEPEEAEAEVTTSKKSATPKADPNTKYRLSESLKQLFVSAAILVHSQELFTYSEAAGLLSKYIISKKDHIFDSRNIMVALVGQDRLGEVFDVTAFHRSQASMFLKKHLLPEIENPQELPKSAEDKPTATVGTQTMQEIKEEPTMFKREPCAELVNVQMPLNETKTLKRCADWTERVLPPKKRTMELRG